MSEEELFHETLQKPPGERAAFLDEACRGDDALRHRVEILLGAHAAPGSFLASPAADLNVTVDQPPATEGPGTEIGPYKLLEQLGEGGFGVVYLAEQAEPIRRKVALKVLKLGMDTRQVVARFEAERQALAIMDHPNIARVFDGGATPSGRPYFVMELVRGVPITEFCDLHKLEPRQRLELFATVCQAVQHAHQKGIIHRDLKPSNVLVTRHDTTPVVKVIDFGVAKALGQELTDKTLFTGVAQMIGTPLYMSPEQAGMSDLDVDTRSDIYSLGVLLYELLTGTTPFPKQRFRKAAYDEIRRIIREEEPPKPSTRLSDSTASLPSVAAQRQTEPAKLTKLVRGELDWIVMKALEKDRTRRYETANGFAADVLRYLSGEAVQAVPPSAGYRLRMFVRRNKGPVLAVSLVFLALVAGFAGTAWQAVRAERARDAEAQRAEGERLAKLDADEKRWLAEQAAAAEKAAKEQIASQLMQIELVNDTVFDIFAGFDIKTVREGGEPVEAELAKKLVAAGRTLDSKAIADPRVLAKVRTRLGQTLLSLGYPREAIELCLAARATLSTVYGPDHPDALTNTTVLASAYYDALQHDQGLPHSEEALKLTKAKHGPNHPDTLRCMNNLAMGYWHTGKLVLALPLLQETLKLRKANLGDDHRETLISMSNLAMGYRDAGKLDLSVPLYEKTLKLMKATHGPDHPDTLICMNNLAEAYQDDQKLVLAVPLLEESLKLKKVKLGRDHPSTLVSMDSLATAYQTAGKLDLALPLFEETLSLRKARLDPDHPSTLASINNLGTCCWLLRRLDKSIPLFEELLPLVEKKHGRTHPNTQMTVANLGVNYRDAGLVAKAIPLLAEAYASSRKHATLRWVGKDLLDAYVRAGEPAKGTKLIDELLDDARRTLPKESPQLAGQLAQFGLALLEMKDYAKAEPLIRESLTIREKVAPDAWTTYNTHSMLGGALSGQKKYADAKPHLLKGYEGLKAGEKVIPPQGQARMTEAVERLVRLYEAMEKKDEAAKWGRELEALKKSTEERLKPKDK